MTDKVNDMEHANNTNPCQGICVQDDDDFCIGCFRTSEEKDKWYSESNEWRENTLNQLKIREEDVFGRGV